MINGVAWDLAAVFSGSKFSCGGKSAEDVREKERWVGAIAGTREVTRSAEYLTKRAAAPQKTS